MIRTKTIFTQISADKRIKPRGALWAIVNDGSYIVIINNLYTLFSGENFQVDASNLYALGTNIIIDNETEFDIRFVRPVIAPQSIGAPPSLVIIDHKSAQLIETVFEF